MKPRIEYTEQRMLIGIGATINYDKYHVGALWKRFMPGLNEIENRLTNDLYSLAVYQPGHFSNFNPSNEFQKWAAAEVANFDHVPVGLERFILPAGLYAVFDYKGLNTDQSIFQYIYEKWLPGSAYELDDRPHFEVLGKNYKNNDPDSEEEIWIPVKPKKSGN